MWAFPRQRFVYHEGVRVAMKIAVMRHERYECSFSGELCREPYRKVCRTPT